MGSGLNDGYFCKEVSDISMDAREDKDTHKEVDFCLSHLSNEGVKSILDVGAGLGRHSINLAQKGHHVTAIENSHDYILEAEKRAVSAGVQINWVHSDLRNYSKSNLYDLAISLYTSFGYHSDLENINCLKNIVQSLKPNGFFVLEMTSRDAVCRNPVETKTVPWGKDGRCIKKNHFDLTTSRRVLKWDFYLQDKLIKTVALEHRLYSIHELQVCFELCGLSVLKVYSDFDKSPTTHLDRKIVIIGKKESEA